MAAQGNTIINNITGEKITWIETSADTNGKFLYMDFEVAPNGSVPVRHVHPNQNEYFEVEYGSLRIELHGKTHILKKGQSFEIAKGSPHQWWNASAELPLKMKIKLEPALNSETFFEQFFGLANAGKTRADGSPNFLQVMAMCNEYEIYIAGPPIPIQKIMAGFIGNLAKIFGYKKFYKEYSRGF